MDNLGCFYTKWLWLLFQFPNQFNAFRSVAICECACLKLNSVFVSYAHAKRTFIIYELQMMNLNSNFSKHNYFQIQTNNDAKLFTE